MRGIFLCEKNDKIFNVYNDEIICELQKLTNVEKKIYTKADVVRESNVFSAVDVVFSTWGMPAFTEEEIRAYLPNLKCVFYGAGSVQKFARPFINCGVKVFSAWAANAIPVAEITVAQIILSNKGYFLTNRIYREMGKAFGDLAPWQIYILTSSENFERIYGARADKLRKLYNGMIPCRLYQYFKPKR